MKLLLLRCSLCLLMSVTALPTHSNADRLSLDLDSTTGVYKILIDGSPWFTSGPTGVTSGHVTSTVGHNLKPSGPASQETGRDDLGSFTSTTLHYSVGDGSSFNTRFVEYQNLLGRGAAIVFEQSFPQGLNDTSPNATDPYAARDQVSTFFPSFNPASNLGYLAFGGDMTGDAYVHGNDPSKIPTGVTGTGPVCFFPQDGSAAVVVSSFSQFMAASSAQVQGSLAYGVQGSITSFPTGYTLSWVLTLHDKPGVNSGFEFWGDVLLSKYGKSREQTYNDYGLKYLSYSTDNGAFYYYQTEDHGAGKRGPPYTGGKTYEETLIDVKQYAESVGIPYRYILLDSWWYYQGVGSGVSNWISRPDVFPHGNSFVRNQTGWPIMGHNRYWAVDNVYAAQNGGQYDFVIEKKGEGLRFADKSWPTEQRFWDDLMYNSTKWGLFMYEQDWLDVEYDQMQYLNTHPTAARTWLLQMGNAAANNGLTVQYCMSHCRHIMQSVEIPAVTNARASGDYHAGGDQWQPLGNTGIFAWALAIAPTKDNFWSTDIQTGSAYKDYDSIREPYNRLQAAVSTLSKGPVAPSDKIGRSDVALILKSCTADGTLLQGDTPAMAIEAQHIQAAFGCNGCGPQGEVWSTSTQLGKMPHKVIMGADLQENYQMPLEALGSNNSVEMIVYEANSTSKLERLNAKTGIEFKACKKWDFQIWAAAPVDQATGLALVGEQDKWVPVSKARFSNLKFSSVSTGGSTEQIGSVVARGSAGEVVKVTWVMVTSAGVDDTTVSCEMHQSGVVEVAVKYTQGTWGRRCNAN